MHIQSLRTFNITCHLQACRSQQDQTITLVNKAIVDYTSPALCTPVTPFPPIGDAAYHQHAGGGPSNGHGQHAQKLVKIHHRVCSSEDILSDTQTDRRTHHQYFATAAAGEVITIGWTYCIAFLFVFILFSGSNRTADLVESA